MEKKVNITDLIAANPSGLLELKPSLTIQKYRENHGFRLENVFTIYQSRRLYYKLENWFAFPGRTLDDLFKVSEKSDGDLLIVYIVETIKNNRVRCHLILSDEAYKEMVSDGSCFILQVHQMYTKYFQDHIALNLSKAI